MQVESNAENSHMNFLHHFQPALFGHRSKVCFLIWWLFKTGLTVYMVCCYNDETGERRLHKTLGANSVLLTRWATTIYVVHVLTTLTITCINMFCYDNLYGYFRWIFLLRRILVLVGKSLPA